MKAVSTLSRTYMVSLNHCRSNCCNFRVSIGQGLWDILTSIMSLAETEVKPYEFLNTCEMVLLEKRVRERERGIEKERERGNKRLVWLARETDSVPASWDSQNVFVPLADKRAVTSGHCFRGRERGHVRSG